MTTTNNITSSTTTINIYNNTDKTINPNTEQINKNQQNVDIPTKVCSKCNTSKYITEFNKRKEAFNGYRGQCKNCEINQLKEYRTENKDKVHERHKEYVKKIRTK